MVISGFIAGYACLAMFALLSFTTKQKTPQHGIYLMLAIIGFIGGMIVFLLT